MLSLDSAIVSDHLVRSVQIDCWLHLIRLDFDSSNSNRSIKFHWLIDKLKIDEIIYRLIDCLLTLIDYCLIHIVKSVIRWRLVDDRLEILLTIHNHRRCLRRHRTSWVLLWIELFHRCLHVGIVRRFKNRIRNIENLQSQSIDFSKSHSNHWFLPILIDDVEDE